VSPAMTVAGSPTRFPVRASYTVISTVARCSGAVAPRKAHEPLSGPSSLQLWRHVIGFPRQPPGRAAGQ
jgi:hypothetical protein